MPRKSKNMLPANSYNIVYNTVYCVGKMSVFSPLNVLLMYKMLMIATADLEHLHHAGHVHMSHEVDGKHNVEFDHDAILGMYTHTHTHTHTHTPVSYTHLTLPTIYSV